jgi:hypothetical protein
MIKIRYAEDITYSEHLSKHPNGDLKFYYVATPGFVGGGTMREGEALKDAALRRLKAEGYQIA